MINFEKMKCCGYRLMTDFYDSPFLLENDRAIRWISTELRYTAIVAILTDYQLSVTWPSKDGKTTTTYADILKREGFVLVSSHHNHGRTGTSVLYLFLRQPVAEVSPSYWEGDKMRIEKKEPIQ